MLYQHHLCIPSSPTLTGYRYSTPSSTMLHLFMYRIGSSFTTCMWPTVEDIWALLSSDCIFPQTLFTCFSKDSGTAQPMFWRVVSKTHSPCSSQVISDTPESPDSGSLAAVPVLLREEMKRYNSLFKLLIISTRTQTLHFPARSAHWERGLHKMRGEGIKLLKIHGVFLIITCNHSRTKSQRHFHWPKEPGMT